ncbi:glycosyltransferase [Clostridium botulinum]|nr:glycosyltransferase [Clostridium botulinum]
MYVLELAKSLEKLGAHVVIGTSGGPLVEVFKHYGLKVVKIPFTSDYISNKNIMKLIKLTKKIIDEEKINLLHCHLFASMRLGNDIYRSYKIPYIVTLHGLFYPNDVLFESCINATKIIAVSKPIKKLIESKLGSRIRGEIMVLPNGIDMENFHPHHTVKHFKAQLGIPENSQIITYCSRLDWGKPLLPKLLFLHVLL